MDMLIVERGANYPEWGRVTQTLRQPVRMLFQQAGESADELYARAIEDRACRFTRAAQRSAGGSSELTQAEA